MTGEHAWFGSKLASWLKFCVALCYKFSNIGFKVFVVNVRVPLGATYFVPYLNTAIGVFYDCIRFDFHGVLFC